MVPILNWEVIKDYLFNNVFHGQGITLIRLVGYVKGLCTT